MPARSNGDGHEQRQQILTATVSLISERGVDTVRLRDVASTAGVSVGMIQHYFESRDRLIEEAFRRFSDDVIAQLHRVTAGPDKTVDQLAALCQAAAAAASVKKRSNVWLDLVSVSSRNPTLRPVAHCVYEAWVESFRAVIAAGVAGGDFPADIDPVVVSEQLVMAVDGLDVASAIGRRGATRQWRVDRLLAAARALLRVDIEMVATETETSRTSRVK